MRSLQFLILPALLLPAGAAEYTTRLGMHTETARLTNGYAPWQSNRTRIEVSDNRHKGAALFVETLDRYGTIDRRNGIEAWVGLPLGINWNGEYIRADNGVIVPETTLGNRLALRLPHGLQIAAGQKANDYATGTGTDITSGELILNTGPWRLGYTRYHAEVEGAGSTDSDRYALHLFYGGGYTALSYARGRELEALPNRQILEMDVLSLSLFGTWRFNTEWSMQYRYEYVEQDRLYLRNGVGISAVYSF